MMPPNRKPARVAKLDPGDPAAPKSTKDAGHADPPPPDSGFVNEDAHMVQNEEHKIKRPLNVVFIGDADAGKSTVAGKTLFLSGQVDEQTIRKYQKEAEDKGQKNWYMAYSMDFGEEERLKGLTVNVGRARFETTEAKFTILGASSCKTHVPKTISGASQADIGILVISARIDQFETAYENNEIHEQLLLAITLGIPKIVVVINKMDEPSVNWSQDRYDDITEKIVEVLIILGYKAKDVRFLPLSGLSGDNMKTRMANNICSWWDGLCFFEILDNICLDDQKVPARTPAANQVGSFIEFDAQLQILDWPDIAVFIDGFKAELHINSIVEKCEIVDPIGEINIKNINGADPNKRNRKKKPLILKNGAIIGCRIQVDTLICIQKFSDSPRLGRFTLQLEGKIIAAGTVIDLPPVGSCWEGDEIDYAGLFEKSQDYSKYAFKHVSKRARHYKTEMDKSRAENKILQARCSYMEYQCETTASKEDALRQLGAQYRDLETTSKLEIEKLQEDIAALRKENSALTNKLSENMEWIADRDNELCLLRDKLAEQQKGWDSLQSHHELQGIMQRHTSNELKDACCKLTSLQKNDTSKAMAKKGLDELEKPPAAFLDFVEEFKAKSRQKGDTSLVVKAAGDKWKSMSEAEKVPYYIAYNKKNRRHTKPP